MSSGTGGRSRTCKFVLLRHTPMPIRLRRHIKRQRRIPNAYPASEEGCRPPTVFLVEIADGDQSTHTNASITNRVNGRARRIRTVTGWILSPLSLPLDYRPILVVFGESLRLTTNLINQQGGLSND